MPSHLKRYHTFGHDHFITFSCYHRLPYLNDDHAGTVFLDTLERTRKKHQFHVFGYVLMPEHVHLLLSEPPKTTFSGGWPIHAFFSARGWGTLPPHSLQDPANASPANTLNFSQD